MRFLIIVCVLSAGLLIASASVAQVRQPSPLQLSTDVALLHMPSSSGSTGLPKLSTAAFELASAQAAAGSIYLSNTAPKTERRLTAPDLDTADSVFIASGDLWTRQFSINGSMDETQPSIAAINLLPALAEPAGWTTSPALNGGYRIRGTVVSTIPMSSF